MAQKTNLKKTYKKIAHQLSPVVTLSEASIVEGAIKPAVLTELERALTDHELIKVKVNFTDRNIRQEVLESLCENCSSELVQTVGKVAILLRQNPKPNLKLSNLERFRNIVNG